MSTKVLVIDDDPFLTDFLKDSLSQSSFEVFVSNSGTEGIKIIHQIQPDVVVLDLMMPGMSGWEVCKTIRMFSQVPILILSAVVDHELVMQALDNGADDYSGFYYGFKHCFKRYPYTKVRADWGAGRHGSIYIYRDIIALSYILRGIQAQP